MSHLIDEEGIGMPEINAEKSLLTLVNVFTTTPATQDRIIELAEESTAEVVSKLPGFVSASFHKSSDGLRVVNYAQWDSVEAFEAMMANPATFARHEEMVRLAEDRDAHFYQVVSTF
jgi:heme-degrading monooxygenase HmoA